MFESQNRRKENLFAVSIYYSYQATAYADGESRIVNCKVTREQDARILGGAAMKSLILKRSVVIAGHRTSISLEDAFWRELKEIAGLRKMALSELIGTIDTERTHANLSSAIRLFVLDFHTGRQAAQAAAAAASRSEVRHASELRPLSSSI
jgi:predicted DNA-binding ribbon-helix-helix protein